MLSQKARQRGRLRHTLFIIYWGWFFKLLASVRLLSTVPVPHCSNSLASSYTLKSDEQLLIHFLSHSFIVSPKWAIKSFCGTVLRLLWIYFKAISAILSHPTQESQEKVGLYKNPAHFMLWSFLNILYFCCCRYYFLLYFLHIVYRYRNCFFKIMVLPIFHFPLMCWFFKT